MDFDINKVIKLIIGNKDNLLFPIKKEAQVCDALVSTIRSLYPKYRVTVEVDVKLNLEIWNNSRSARIDIVVDDNNGNFIPIEVKFKKQGINKATDEGKFHFFYDLYRIEYLKQLNCIPNTVLKNFVSGYSIMFTNNKDYLTDKNKKNANKPINEQNIDCYFNICPEAKQIVKGKEYDWNRKSDSKGTFNKKSYNILKPFVYKQSYDLEWHQFIGDFQYLALKTKR